MNWSTPEGLIIAANSVPFTLATLTGETTLKVLVLFSFSILFKMVPNSMLTDLVFFVSIISNCEFCLIFTTDLSSININAAYP